MAADEPLITDEEIECEADSTVDRGLRGYLDAVTGGGNPNQADMEWAADTIRFARRIEALVRKRLAERLRDLTADAMQAGVGNDYRNGMREAARIVEGDGEPYHRR